MNLFGLDDARHVEGEALEGALDVVLDESRFDLALVVDFDEVRAALLAVLVNRAGFERAGVEGPVVDLELLVRVAERDVTSVRNPSASRPRAAVCRSTPFDVGSGGGC